MMQPVEPHRQGTACTPVHDIDTLPRSPAHEQSRELELHWVKRFRVVEWVVTAIMLIILIAVGHYGPVHCRSFTWDDGTINLPLETDTFPSWSLVPIAILPAAVYAPIAFMFPLEEHRRLEQVGTTWLMHLTSVTLAELFVEPMKLLAGRLRPDFLARLQSVGIEPPTSLMDIESTYYNYCNVTAATVVEGRKSFPSGHSSWSFSSMLSLSLFLIHRLGAFRRGSFIRLVVGGLPMILAVVVAISRTWDYHHHFSDILCGALIGTFAALCSFKLHFESVVDTATGTARLPGAPDVCPLLPPNPAEAVPKFTVRRRREQLEYVV